MKKLALFASTLMMFAFGPGCSSSDVGSSQKRVDCFDTSSGVLCTDASDDDGSDDVVDLDGDGQPDDFVCSDEVGSDGEEADHDGDDDGIDDESDGDDDDDGVDDASDGDDDDDGIDDADDCDSDGIDAEDHDDDGSDDGADDGTGGDDGSDDGAGL
jgi:hypothetical protein